MVGTIADRTTINIEQITDAEITVVEERTELNGFKETITAPVIASKPKKELPKTSSLGSIRNELHQERATGTEEDKVELTTENMLVLWRGFLTENKEHLQGSFLNVAERQVPQIIQDKVVFTESNNVSLEILQLYKSDMVSYLIKKSSAVTVHLDFILQKKEEPAAKTYKSQKERLKELIEKNDAVLKLIQKFDLNLD
ncbi:MAG: hypothetical protein IPM95_03685 [Sphingobacteriales bacterium]|nr:hypothetical protein [Sphingobacteriales bacterium]